MIENKAELNELRIQEDRSRRNNIKVEGIDEDENERSFLYDELENTDELYIQRADRVRRREGVNDNSNKTPRIFVAIINN